MYMIIWQFDVRPGSEASFEAAYGSDGDWDRLFRTAEGYLGTSLLRDTSADARYFTMDRWASRSAFETFLRESRKAYDALDKTFEGLTESETRVLAVETPPAP